MAFPKRSRSQTLRASLGGKTGRFSEQPIRPASFAWKLWVTYRFPRPTPRPRSDAEPVSSLTPAPHDAFQRPAPKSFPIRFKEGPRSIDDRGSNRRRLLARRCEPNTTPLRNRRSWCLSNAMLFDKTHNEEIVTAFEQARRSSEAVTKFSRTNPMAICAGKRALREFPERTE